MYIPFEGHLNKLQRIYLGKDELYFPLLRYDRFEILVSTKENLYFIREMLQRPLESVLINE